MIYDTIISRHHLNPGKNSTPRFSMAYLVALIFLATGCNGTGVESNTVGPTTEPLDSDNPPSAIEQLVTPLEGNAPFSNGFNDERLVEVSGVQRASTTDGVYYVHNDSGEPIVYATDAFGQILGTVTVGSDEAIDWEALSAVRINTTSNLVIADIGNNNGQRRDINLLVVEEPQLNELSPGFKTAVTGGRIELSYGDGLYYDAEGLIVDDDTIILLTKDRQNTSNQSIWTGSLSNGLTSGSVVLDYAGLVSLSSANTLNAITDVDIHPARNEVAVLTYGSIIGTGRIHLWTLRDDESIADTLTRSAEQVINIPVIGTNVQAEGISYSDDGSYLLVAAEGVGRSTLTIVAR